MTLSFQPRHTTAKTDANWTAAASPPEALYILPTGWRLYYFQMEFRACEAVTVDSGNDLLLGKLRLEMDYSRGLWVDDWQDTQNATSVSSFEAEIAIFEGAATLLADPPTQTWIRFKNFAVERGCLCDGALCPLCLCDACFCQGDTTWEEERLARCTAMNPTAKPVDTRTTDDGRELKVYDEWLTGEIEILVGSKDVVRLCQGCRMQILNRFCIGAAGKALRCPSVPEALSAAPPSKTDQARLISGILFVGVLYSAYHIL